MVKWSSDQWWSDQWCSERCRKQLQPTEPRATWLVCNMSPSSEERPVNSTISSELSQSFPLKDPAPSRLG